MSNNEIVQGFDDEKDAALTITLEKAREAEEMLIVSLSGSVDPHNAPFLQKQMVKAIEKGYTKLIFHCAGLGDISSAGIGAFSHFLNLVKAKGGDLVFFGIQPKVQGVLQVLGFAQVFTTRETRDESAGVFRSPPPPAPDGRFPVTAVCPACSQTHNVMEAGRFNCSRCKTALITDRQGQVFLG
ncbi:MAG: STAS domain-containing protein [Spirochaetaceae bacterium]|jgi:anti-anti-sigma factor|nr:STAS domain-containing protein [Spirochaetaceae bacterium]